MYSTLPRINITESTGYASISAYAVGTSAVSTEAFAISEAAAKITEHVESSQALFGDKSAALSVLSLLAMDCAEADWDGAGADAIDILAIRNAESVIRALPDNIPMPELSAEPDGAVSLDWIISKHRIFSVSVSASPRLSYAWLDGSDRGHGVARFENNSIPLRIIEGIRGVLRHVNITFRP